MEVNEALRSQRQFEDSRIRLNTMSDQINENAWNKSKEPDYQDGDTLAWQSKYQQSDRTKALGAYREELQLEHDDEYDPEHPNNQLVLYERVLIDALSYHTDQKNQINLAAIRMGIAETTGDCNLDKFKLAVDHVKEQMLPKNTGIFKRIRYKFDLD